MLVGILKKLVGIMIGPVGILKNACRYFETVGFMNVGIMNVGIMNATPFLPFFFARATLIFYFSTLSKAGRPPQLLVLVGSEMCGRCNGGANVLK